MGGVVYRAQTAKIHTGQRRNGAISSWLKTSYREQACTSSFLQSVDARLTPRVRRQRRYWRVSLLSD